MKAYQMKYNSWTETARIDARCYDGVSTSIVICTIPAAPWRKINLGKLLRIICGDRQQKIDRTRCDALNAVLG